MDNLPTVTITLQTQLTTDQVRKIMPGVLIQARDQLIKQFVTDLCRDGTEPTSPEGIRRAFEAGVSRPELMSAYGLKTWTLERVMGELHVMFCEHCGATRLIPVHWTKLFTPTPEKAPVYCAGCKKIIKAANRWWGREWWFLNWRRTNPHVDAVKVLREKDEQEELDFQKRLAAYKAAGGK